MFGAAIRSCGLLLAIALPVAVGHAQSLGEPTDAVPRSIVDDSLEQRVERLEQQNKFLLEKLNERIGPHPADSPARPAAGPSRADAGGSAKPSGSGEKIKMEPVWRNGLWFESADKNFRYSVGGTIQFDVGGYIVSPQVRDSIGVMNGFLDPGLALQDGMDFRRARLRLAGTAYEVIDFFAQYDFANSLDLRRRTIGVTPGRIPTIYDLNPGEPVQFNEVYVGVTQVPLLGAVRIGHHREGLNFITSTADRNQVWMERGPMFDAFNGDFNFASGVTVDRTYFGERAYSWLGFFQNNSRGFSTLGDGTYAYDVRLTGLPVWDEESELWVHLGVDYSYRVLTLNQIRYRARPMIRIGNNWQVPNIVDTGLLFSEDPQQIVNFEFASAWGPWTFAAEACGSWVTNAYAGGLPRSDGTLPPGVFARGTYFAEGYYVELLRFLTPDHRGYRKERPGYDRVVPHENFSINKGAGPHFGSGAWEVGVRYDYLNLTDAGVNGGTTQAVTAAINWYLNPNTRFQLNGFVMHRQFAGPSTGPFVDGSLSGIGMRVNMDF